MGVPGVARLASSLSGPYLPLGILYLVQGFPYGLQSSLLPVLLRTQGLSLSRIGLTRVLYLPWLLKVAWAPLVDGWWSRRTWLVVSTGGLCVCCLLCSTLPPGATFTLLAWLLLLMHILSSMQDVALDAVTVAVLSQEQVGLGNSLQVVAYKLGSVVAGGGALTLLDVLGWRMVFLLLAGGYLLAAGCACWTQALKGAELGHRETSKGKAMSPGATMRRVFRVPGTVWTIIYVLIYKLGDQGALAMVPLLLLDHGTSAAELGLWNGILSLMFSIAGSALGGILLGKGRSIKLLLKILLSLRLCGLILQTLLLSSLSRDTGAVKGCLLLSLLLLNFLAGVTTTTTFTLMMNCTRRADPRIQAGHYGLLSSLEVLGKVCCGAASGLLLDSLGLTVCFSVFILLSGLPLLHLRTLPPSLS